MNLPLKPYKGARDFYPEDELKQKYMFDAIRKTVKLYGYEEYNAPILEPIELYKAKSGTEIVNDQTYKFIDRGGREVAIRPEMTPTVSRMIAGKRQQLAYPIRWFSIPNLWRYERPQRGRLREHWQLNVDLFGIDGMYAELELIMLANSIFKEFKADSSMYQIKLNSRHLMNDIFDHYLHLDKDQESKIAKAIDRKNKISQTVFIELIDSILSSGQKENGLTETIINLLGCTRLNDLPTEIKKYASYKELVAILNLCHSQGINNAVFDISIMRGFDYYTGIVFEIFDTHLENNRSMMGGGRYDGLVGLFGVEPIATVGFGLGDATLFNFLSLHGLMPDLKPETEIYVAIIDDEYESALKILNVLREHSINVAVDFSGKKVGDQIKSAQKKQINLVLIIGPQEIKKSKYTLRKLDSSEENAYELDQLISLFKTKKT
jgi:histidyl-tRNA synthetase